ncbi:MAG: nitrogen regulation protein NR(II) [Phycisphaerae bacterium]
MPERKTPGLPDRVFRRLCEGLGFICIAVDRDLRITFWNDEASNHFGGTQEQRQGDSFLSILSESDQVEAERLIRESIETKSTREMEVKFSEESGERKTLVLIVSPILDEDGDCIAASASMRDISKRKRLSRELAQSRRMAAMGQMSGAMAHHFNNILGGMLTSVDYVLTSDSPRELRRTLRMLAKSIGRATRITHQLAAFAESENEQVEWIPINPIMESFLDRVRPRAKVANIQLETNIASVTSEPFDAQRLMPILDSLVQNALDAMPGGGMLRIEMLENEDSAEIRISDTGCGIPEDMLDRVFEPFFTTKGELAGGKTSNIGLGLAAVHGLVAEMGGTIHLTSKIGEGTQVMVRIPLHRSKG